MSSPDLTPRACPTCEATLVDHLFGELAAAPAAAFAAHLASSPGCRRDAEELAATLAVAGRHTQVEPSPELISGLKAEARKQAAERRASTATSERELGRARRTASSPAPLGLGARLGQLLTGRFAVPAWAGAAAVVVLVAAVALHFQRTGRSPAGSHGVAGGRGPSELAAPARPAEQPARERAESNRRAFSDARIPADRPEAGEADESRRWRAEPAPEAAAPPAAAPPAAAPPAAAPPAAKPPPPATLAPPAPLPRPLQAPTRGLAEEAKAEDALASRHDAGAVAYEGIDGGAAATSDLAAEPEALRESERQAAVSAFASPLAAPAPAAAGRVEPAPSGEVTGEVQAIVARLRAGDAAGVASRFDSWRAGQGAKEGLEARDDLARRKAAPVPAQGLGRAEKPPAKLAVTESGSRSALTLPLLDAEAHAAAASPDPAVRAAALVLLERLGAEPDPGLAVRALAAAVPLALDLGQRDRALSALARLEALDPPAGAAARRALERRP